MEKNMLETEIVDFVASQEVGKQGPRGMKTAAAAGGLMIAGALLWNYVGKPLAGRIKRGIQNVKASRNKVEEPKEVNEVRKPKN